MTATLRQGLAGALGGGLGFLLLEPGIRREELSGESGGALSLLAVGFLLGGLITFCLALAEEASTGRWLRMLTRGVMAGMGGAVLGYVFLLLATWLYHELAPLNQVGVPALQVLRRTLVWGIWGCGLGMGVGVVSRSARRLLQGCVGGLLGGLAGGLLFDVLSLIFGGAGVGRFVGFAGIGLCVGLATALVEQLTSVAWVQFLSGSREGQSIYLHRDTVVLGRDELADVPLFGEPVLSRAQAILQLTPAPTIHEVGAEPLLRVDGTPLRSAALYDGALIEIGAHRLRFHQREGVVRDLSREPEPKVSAVALDVTLHGAELPRNGGSMRGSTGAEFGGGAAVLRCLAGPDVKPVVALRPGLTLGRERDNDVPLVDARVSRYHARIDFIEGAWVLSDLGSSNGTRLNGVRIVRGGLQPGDYLYLGDCVLRVEEENR